MKCFMKAPSILLSVLKLSDKSENEFRRNLEFYICTEKI